MTLTCICLVVIALAMTAVLVNAGAEYYPINGLLCMNSEFIVNHDSACATTCGILCDLRQDCQGFTVATGPCQLFVFNKCSRYFRNCSCSDRGQVFVKRLPGLPPGGFQCPSGFANGVCGTKYKLFAGDWTTAKAAIEAEAGLVTMADVVDSTEYSYTVNRLTVAYNYSNPPLAFMMLGGRQHLGTVSTKKSNWYWVSCNSFINRTVWRTGEPNNGGDQNMGIVANYNPTGMSDDSAVTYNPALSGGPRRSSGQMRLTV